MNLKAVKDTPDYLLKDITISDNQLFKDLNNIDIPIDKQNAFNIKAEAELKGIKSNDAGFISEGKTAEKLSFGQGENKVNLGSMLDAELCTKMLDMIVPSMFVLLLRVGAGIKVNKKDLQATPKELEMISPIMQKCLEVIEFNINNPFVALGLVIGVVYTTKAADIGINKALSGDIEGAPTYHNAERKTRKPRSDAGKKRA